jgi:hypothetical protein
LQPSWINARPVAMQLCRALHLRRATCFQPPRLLETLALAQLPITALRVMLWPKLVRRDEELWGMLAPTLRELTFEQRTRPPLAVLEVGLLGELRELELHDPHVDMPLMTHLTAPGQLPALRRLSLRRVEAFDPPHAPELLLWLIACGVLERVEALELGGVLAGVELVPTLLDALRHSPLRTLSLAKTPGMGRGALNQLLNLAPLNAQLEQLTFGAANRPREESLRIDTPLPRLRELTLTDMTLTRADGEALHPDNLPALRRLDLSRCDASDDLLDHLEQLPWPDPPPQIEAPRRRSGAKVLGTIDEHLLMGRLSLRPGTRGGRRDS